MKPNSPEFAEAEELSQRIRLCDMPGCGAHGDHKAPKDRALSDYYHFCIDHVREYNKAWNFFEGMSEHEVQEHMMSSLYGDRPTWRYDAEGSAEDILRHKAWQTQNFSDESFESYKKARREIPPESKDAAEVEALAVLGLSLPTDLDEIKAQYKKLAKKHHPDLNKGCKTSEDLLKKVNMAYTILKVAYAAYEKLPER